MELIRNDTIKVLSNPGCDSRQLLYPGNSQSERITLTEVHVAPGATQPRHAHAASEQIWYALRGAGVLLLGDGQEVSFSAGDVVRFADGDIHGLRNDGSEPFVYVSVTSPPIHFGPAYRNER